MPCLHGPDTRFFRGVFWGKNMPMKHGVKSKSAVLEEGFNREKEITPTKKDLAEGKKLINDLDKDDGQSAYEMLETMRWVFKKVKGKKKLLDIVKKDNKQFVAMIRELMKIETALLSAKIKAEGGETGPNNNFFVVLKGLEDEIKIEDGPLDMKQIGRVMNPDGTEA